MQTKFDTIVRANLKFISPEEVVESFECGFIPDTKIDFVKDIVDNAEIVKPITFDEWKGSFNISTKRGFNSSLEQNSDSNNHHESVLMKNAETEINDKMSALLSFYGDRIILLSSHDIINKLNEVLNLSYVHNISNVEIRKKLSLLNDDGQISDKCINLYESEEAPQKQ